MQPDSIQEDAYVFLDANQMLGAIRSRQISCRELMLSHLTQIERVNPTLNAIVTLDADRALNEADAIDRALMLGEDVGALGGLPVAIKDTTATAGLRTTMGSPIFRDCVPANDALIVERLRAAGAIVIGKTNVPEFAAGSQTFNTIFGVTRNPYDLKQTCGGSSGGAAVSLAAGFCALADGSDMGGSLRNPASFCNVVGLRPTPGRVPSWPGKNPWGNLAVPGPMARNVRDVALMLSAIAGPDYRVPTALETPASRFTGDLNRDFRGTPLAFSPDFGGQMPVDFDVVAVLETARRVFIDMGMTVSDSLPSFADGQEIFVTQRSVTFEATLGPLMDKHRHLMKEDLIWNIEYGRKLTGAEISAAERNRTFLFERVRTFMEKTPFLALPVSQVPPFSVEQAYVNEIQGQRMANYLEWMQSCCVITVTGCPAISVPCGFTPNGLPVGIQLVGRYGDDWGLLQLAHAFEQATSVGKTRPRVATKFPTHRIN